MTDDTECPDDLKALRAECQPKHVDLVQAILSGEHPSNTAAYLSVYPGSTRESANTSVVAVLAIPSVKALYNALREAKFMEGVMSRAEVMQRLSNMARTSLADLLEFGSVSTTDKETGVVTEFSTWRFKDSKDLTPEAMAAIHELSNTKEGHKIKLHDAKVAMRQLAEMSGWNEAQKVDVNHKGASVNIYLPDNGRDSE